jgi:adenosylcobinamide-GDP ribazoletransferase
LGSVLALAGFGLAHVRVEVFVSSVILVVLLIIMTGGLHLDGLADTADAFFSGKDKDEMLRIMRDPHVGAMGVLALISILMLKVAFLSSISSSALIPALILVCVLSRWSMVLSLFLFAYARAEGKAKIFHDGINVKIFFTATLFALAIVFVMARMAGLVLFGVAAAFTYTLNLAISRKIGGVTGDTIGAVSELTEVVLFMSIIILERTFL